MLITEYGHVFWNKYRYEQGVFHRRIRRHARVRRADRARASRLHMPDAGDDTPFGCAHDPVNKVSEFLAAHMLLRRDVSEAKPSVRVDYSTADALEKLFIGYGMNSGAVEVSARRETLSVAGLLRARRRRRNRGKVLGGSAVVTYPGLFGSSWTPRTGSTPTRSSGSSKSAG